MSRPFKLGDRATVCGFAGVVSVTTVTKIGARVTCADGSVWHRSAGRDEWRLYGRHAMHDRYCTLRPFCGGRVVSELPPYPPPEGPLDVVRAAHARLLRVDPELAGKLLSAVDVAMAMASDAAVAAEREACAARLDEHAARLRANAATGRNVPGAELLPLVADILSQEATAIRARGQR